MITPRLTVSLEQFERDLLEQLCEADNSHPKLELRTLIVDEALRRGMISGEDAAAWKAKNAWRPKT